MKLKHIVISGNIGVGKTTLAEKLAKKYNWKILLEEVDNNPYLDDFYKSMKSWSFHLQIFFLNSRFKQIQKICDQFGGESCKKALKDAKISVQILMKY